MQADGGTLLRQQGPAGRSPGRLAAVRARTGRRGLAQALGGCTRLRGDDHSSVRWYAVARAEYDASVARGEALYLHHLASMNDDRA